MEDDSKPVTELGIAPLVARGLGLFESLTLALQDDYTKASQVRLYLSRFKLWVGNLGAHRKSGGRSLEYRLRDASHIRKLVISLLSDLCKSIEEGTLIANQERSSDTGSACFNHEENELAEYFNDDEGSNKSETDKTLDEIAHVIACLLRLSITISNPSPHTQFLTRVDDGLIESYVHWDANHVREKFNNVSERLANRLGRAMARRRLYFKYRKEHRNRLAQGLVDDGDQDEQATTVASSLPEQLKEIGETCSISLTQVDDVASNASSTSYGTSVPDSTQLRVPSIPKEYKDGPFNCPFCRMIISIDTRYAWKKHVFRDLRPYICLSDVCKTPEHLYIRRREWTTHMRREHWKSWHCPFECSTEFDRPDRFQSHIEVSHKHEISSDKMHALSELSGITNRSKAKGQCPLCCDFEVSSEKQYEKHIGQHLEQLALFALPWIVDDGKADEEDEQPSTGEEKSDDDNDDGNKDGEVEDRVIPPVPETFDLKNYASKTEAAMEYILWARTKSRKGTKET